MHPFNQNDALEETMKNSVILTTCFITLLILPGCAQTGQNNILDSIERALSAGTLTEDRIRAGLREALSVGIDRTVRLVGREDGYFKDQDIKILLPESVQRFENTLRVAGLGPQIDEFVLSMNRAAETAAPHAKDIFIDAIVSMEIEDARRILNGNDTEATDYLEEHTTARLTEAFTPIMRDTMAQYGVVQKFNEIESRYAAVSVVARSLDIDLDVEKYAVEKALDGLFYVLGQEEKKIRTDPAARTTELLRQVFGKR